MNVQVHRRPGRRVVMIDGEPHTVGSAAERLGLKVKTLEKRLDRGTRPTLPLQRHARA